MDQFLHKICSDHRIGSYIIEDEDGTVWIIAEPINRPGLPYPPDIAATDSYDEEVAEGSGSMGATIGYRVFNGMSKDYNMPVSLVYERGDSSNDDTFYGNSLKLCVYYSMSTGVEYSKIAIIQYFIDCGAQRYLTEKPQLKPIF